MAVDDVIVPPQYQVFVNFRGAELRNNFVSILVKVMEIEKVNVFTDEREAKGTGLPILLERIEESRVAVAIFSERYTESHWCLDELVKMNEQRGKGELVVIPVFYKLDATACKNLDGAFGDKFRKLERQNESKPEMIKKWKEALASVFNNMGLTSNEHSKDSEFADLIVKEVKRVLIDISTKESENSKNPTIGANKERLTDTEEREEPIFGDEQRLKQLEEKLEFLLKETRFVGVVGMPGIGKTTLAKMMYEKWEHKFRSSMFFPDVCKLEDQKGSKWMRRRLMQELLKAIHPNIGHKVNTHEYWEDELLKSKVLIVLDNVGHKEQIEVLLGKERDWIKKGSKIVITSSDESVLQELVNDTYVVPRLNSKDSLQFFKIHAFDLKLEDYAKGNFLKLSRHFLDYAKGNPLALKALGVQLRGKDEAYWKQRIGTLTQRSNRMVQDFLRTRYPELTQRQKDAFIDVACFFKSDNASYVNFLVDSCDDIRDLTNKFLVSISGGRVEMRHMLCTFAKELASQALTESTSVQFRLLNYQDIIRVLQNKLDMKNVRGVLLDMSKVPEKMSFDANIFSSMCSLLYMRIYSSVFVKEGEADFNFGVPKELQLPLNKLRYLHWLKFPLEKLPSDFNAVELVTLELPYSSIKKLWEDVKDTPKLKLVDLSYSPKLRNLSGLSTARNLERLNLEGCKRLVKLPQEMKNMNSLIFLNMRGCERLKFLPMMKLSSLKILILSDCSKLQEFEVISHNLEALYLDGTALKELPPTIGDLKRLAILNLKGCKMLESLPECLGKHKALKELILSGCTNLETVPKNMRYLRSLLLDGTRIKEMPNIYSLQRLYLSRNYELIRLQDNISNFDHLKWLDLKNCKNLRYLPTLPPNLEFFDAHGCQRLEAVADPLSLRMMTEHIRSSFFFTNCINLTQNARDVISSYAQWKCHQLALECYDRGVVSGALFHLCYPGFEVPLWFHHKAVGSVLEPRLQVQPQLCNNRLSGIALCAVVSFRSNQASIDTFSVKCKLQFKNIDGTPISLDFDVGGLIEPGRIESEHVFIGYASCSHLTKHLEDSRNSIPTKAFLEFYMIDPRISEVVSCGISLVYAEPQNVPVEANHYISSSKESGSWVEDFFGYILTAFLCVVIFAPQYYLRFLNIFGPLLVIILFFIALALILEWKVGKPKQQKDSHAPEPV